LDWTRDIGTHDAVDVTGGDSVFSGIFEVADKKDPFFEGVDGLKVEIKVHWYGRRTPTPWAALL